ncbi:ATP-dependent RNA helicase RhlE [Verrucomicrobium sp. GAS474]|uniref:DEAD/DEAH box helicase n=1 Tax=Verrucomicrobium sp. GAS474 TaxID=1882831 RepID=UPI00087B510A|nr:DEAD/DEAH box helicase [Verrucomicrobium sp. GAS474]SDU03990.1 ATP-dependent RNA helicase RhlE [Verrucomicrobium sp. GAS474]
MTTPLVPVTDVTFASLKLCEPLQQALAEKNYIHPSPIQAGAIPHLLEGRDLVGIAQTGTGKTAAFALPILHRLAANPKVAGPRQMRVLILTPTRELATQIGQSFVSYGKHLRLSKAVIFGGVGQGPQVTALRRGLDVVIATPGRLLDLVQQRHADLSQVEVFVLDEADRMLDMGFIHDIRKILAILPANGKRQSLLFSATMPDTIQEIAAKLLHNPARVEVTPVATTAERIDQHLCQVSKDNKPRLLVHLLQKEHTEGLVLVFVRMKHGANRLVDRLAIDGIKADAIHGNKSQGARQRALENFRDGKVRVLVATDIAARGIDVKGITLVVNYDLPEEPESYVHRIGRTARAGKEGVAIAFCAPDERGLLRDIERTIRQPIPLRKEHPFAPTAAEAAAALHVPDAPRGGGGGGRRGGGGGGNRGGGRSFGGGGGGGRSSSGGRPSGGGQGHSGPRSFSPRSSSGGGGQHRSPGGARGR